MLARVPGARRKIIRENALHEGSLPVAVKRNIIPLITLINCDLSIDDGAIQVLAPPVQYAVIACTSGRSRSAGF